MSENSYGQTRAPTTATFTKIISMVKVNMFGLMAEFTKEAGSTIKWKDQELLHGATADATLANIKMTKNTDKVLSSGQMVENILENGIRANSTEMAFT